MINITSLLESVRRSRLAWLVPTLASAGSVVAHVPPAQALVLIIAVGVITIVSNLAFWVWFGMTSQATQINVIRLFEAAQGAAPNPRAPTTGRSTRSGKRSPGAEGSSASLAASDEEPYAFGTGP